MRTPTPHPPDLARPAPATTDELQSAVASAPPQIAIPWIIRLRIGLALGELALVIATSTAFDVDVPLALAAAIIALQGTTNWLLARASATPGKPHVEHLVGSLFATAIHVSISAHWIMPAVVPL